MPDGTGTRTAIVTGASKGIGAAADDHRTVVNHAASAAEAEKVAAVRTAGGKAIAVAADAAAAGEPFNQAEAAFGPVDVPVNNAGVLKNAPLAEVADADFRRVLAVNLVGTFNGVREAARRMRDGGRTINLSTSVVGAYQPTFGAYVATKAAVDAMTHVLAKEPGSRGITVNAVAPGPVAPGLVATEPVATRLFPAGRSEEPIRRTTSDIPPGRLGQPDDVAPAVAFLAGPESGRINGRIVKANGGRN